MLHVHSTVHLKSNSRGLLGNKIIIFFDNIEVSPNFQWCPPRKNSYVSCFQGIHHKLYKYINRKVMSHEPFAASILEYPTWHLYFNGIHSSTQGFCVSDFSDIPRYTTQKILHNWYIFSIFVFY